jgi:hypothetical protein
MIAAAAMSTTAVISGTHNGVRADIIGLQIR